LSELLLLLLLLLPLPLSPLASSPFDESLSCFFFFSSAASLASYSSAFFFKLRFLSLSLITGKNARRSPTASTHSLCVPVVTDHRTIYLPSNQHCLQAIVFSDVACAPRADKKMLQSDENLFFQIVDPSQLIAKAKESLRLAVVNAAAATATATQSNAELAQMKSLLVEQQQLCEARFAAVGIQCLLICCSVYTRT
jgi:hypothetical protein